MRSERQVDTLLSTKATNLNNLPLTVQSISYNRRRSMFGVCSIPTFPHPQTSEILKEIAAGPVTTYRRQCSHHEILCARHGTSTSIAFRRCFFQTFGRSQLFSSLIMMRARPTNGALNRHFDSLTDVFSPPVGGVEFLPCTQTRQSWLKTSRIWSVKHRQQQ